MNDEIIKHDIDIIKQKHNIGINSKRLVSVLYIDSDIQGAGQRLGQAIEIGNKYIFTMSDSNRCIISANKTNPLQLRHTTAGLKHQQVLGENESLIVKALSTEELSILKGNISNKIKGKDLKGIIQNGSINYTEKHDDIEKTGFVD